MKHCPESPERVMGLGEGEARTLWWYKLSRNSWAWGASTMVVAFSLSARRTIACTRSESSSSRT